MASLLYYLPNLQALNADRVSAAGLGYLLDTDGGPEWAATTRGPDGGKGVVFSAPSRGSRAAVSQSDEARWERIHGTEAWVGVLDGDQPTPADLERPKAHAGHWVTLADGQRWLVPVARMIGPGGETPLPRRLTWDGAAWTRGEVLPRYRELWQHACRLWDDLVGASESDEPALSWDDEVGLAAQALAINYRVGFSEVSALGLLTTETEAEVLKALVDLPSLEALRGNARSGEPCSPRGNEA